MNKFNFSLDFKVIIFFQLIICVLVSWYLFGGNLRALWDVIDDHEIFYLIGTSQYLSVDRIFIALENSEVFKFGDYPRYRPSYYILRVLECVIWGKTPFYWYFSRIILLSVSLFLYWRVLQLYLGVIASGIFIVYLMSYPFWGDLFSRLGPAETYCTIGLAFYVYGFSKLLLNSNIMSSKIRFINILLLTLGALICLGSKENFIILLASSWILFIYLYLRGYRSKTLFISVIIQSIYAFVIITSLFIYFSKFGVDVYSNSVSFSYRITLLEILLKQNMIQILVLATVLIGIIYIVSKIYNLKTYLPIFTKGFIATLVLIVVYIIQFVFYNGHWPNNTRYDFPGVLAIPIFISVIYWIISKLLEVTNSSFNLQPWFSSLICLFLLYLIFDNIGYEHHLARAKANVTSSRLFTERIEKLKKIFIQKPSVPVIFVTSDINDYEPLFSYQRFLKNMGVSNPISIETRYNYQYYPDSLLGKLQTELVNISKHGDANFAPLPDKLEKCYAIVFSGVASALGCKNV